MQPTGDRIDEPPFEADAADAAEQSRSVVESDDDRENGDDGSGRRSSGPGPGALDLDKASEADLAEQLHEVGYDDDDR